ncbi:MAG: TatD family hydrolase [Candidatus Eremiobacteraeota bacterium]|nr:TatD family hydrolase [Candidatus Eremiobacteraeota bacterium]
MIDSHAHIHDRAFEEDRAAMIERARTAGVDEIITVGCDIADTARAIACANEFELYASAGIHPHEAKSAPADIAAAFAPFLADPRVIAIGETGLDYYYKHSDRDAQIRVLRDQLRLARERNYPVIFHQRDAYDDFMSVLREEFVSGMRGVIHCFTGDAQQARTYTSEFGLLLGIGGVFTFKTASNVRDAVKSVGIEHLIVETDCPYLAPVPLRGKRNEPAFITHTAQLLADELALPLATVLSTTDATARSLFALRR